MKRLSLFVLVLVTGLLATTALAAGREAVIIVVDAESGRALIPDGTPLPQGLTVYGADGKALTFANAPEERFAAARKSVASTAPFAHAVPFVTLDKGRPERVPASGNRFVVRPNVDNSDVTYYVTFYDGSYISARRVVYDVSPYGVQYGVQTAAYTPENDYHDGWLYAEQSSSDHPGYNTTAYCTINYAGGYCSTGLYAYQDSGSFSAHVTSSGNVHHHRLPICGRYGEPPCSENLSGSIEIYFP
jgi:hypothetical protein